MAQTVSRRRFLFLSLAIAAVPLAQACAPQAPTPTQPAKPPEGAKPAPTSGPAATAATQPTPGAKPAVQATAKPAEAIKRGGTVVQAINWTYPTMDPHLTTIHYNVGYEAMYNGLVRFELVDPKTWEHKVVGDLAESWEQPDAKTVVFHLKKGVTFHDGSDFDATVAAWNFDRARTHAKSQK
ncbi:MAG TPA: ABC transporter substrate-binding protein, partial [Chloroflexota bacterium]